MSMTIDEKIAVLNDCKAGHPIQFRPEHYADDSQEHWKDCPEFKRVEFNFGWADYRRKPKEPKLANPAREWWLPPNPVIAVLISNTPVDGWIHVREVIDL